MLIIERSQHTLSRSAINPSALKVLYGLKNAGYQACLVGGGVRDLLLGRQPKDFDVATNAHPEQIQQLFSQCHLIGRRFRLAHVRVNQDIVEVATFRAHHEAGSGGETEANGRIIRDNVYGSLEEDAYRRDFTVNGLYYNIHDFSIIDYVGGMTDLKQRLLRLIGPAEQRYREDPVRMLRALRFKAKLGFNLDIEAAQMIMPLGHLLTAIPASRLYEEVLKLLLSGHGMDSFRELAEYRLLPYLLTHYQPHDSANVIPSLTPNDLLWHALQQTDQRVAAGQSVSPTFLWAALLWQPLQESLCALCSSNEANEADKADKAENTESLVKASDVTLHQAIQAVLARQQSTIAVPYRILRPMLDIWVLQPAFRFKQHSKKALRFIQHPSFRAAYDFLNLRIRIGVEDPTLGEWWKVVQETEALPALPLAANKPGAGKRKRRRKKWTQG